MNHNLEYIIGILIIVILIENLHGKSCVKRKSMYHHNNENSVENKQSVDFKAEAINKYLEIAESKEKNKFISEFNWLNISHSIEYKFLNNCVKNVNGEIQYRYNYDYSYSLRIFIQMMKKGSSFVQARKETATCLIQKLTMVKDIQKHISKTGNNYKFSMPGIEYVKYYLNSPCNNITIGSVNINNFTVFGDESSKASIENLDITFSGVSIQYPYMDSDAFPNCITSIINLCKKDANVIVTVIKKTLLGQCENSSISLMADTMNPPNEYLEVLKKYSLKDDENTRLFYNCMLENNTNRDCLNYISLEESTSIKYLKTLSPYLHKNSARSKRSAQNDTLGDEDLECMYENYEPYSEGSEYSECISSKKRKRKRKKRAVTSISTESDDEYASIAKYLGVSQKDILPSSASHIQVGIYGDSSGILGDGAIIERLSQRARQVFSQYMPHVPIGTSPQNIISELDKAVKVSSSSRDPVMAGIHSVASNKLRSVKSVLRNNDVSYSDLSEAFSETNIDGFSTRILGGNSINTINDKKIVGNNMYSKIKETISSYKSRGNNVVLTRYNQRDDNLLFSVDSGTSILKPSRAVHFQESSSRSGFRSRLSSLDSDYRPSKLDNLNRQKSMSVGELNNCGTYGSNAACALLGNVPEKKHKVSGFNMVMEKIRNSKITQKKIAKLPITSSILTRPGIRNTISHVNVLNNEQHVQDSTRERNTFGPQKNARSGESIFSRQSSVMSRGDTYSTTERVGDSIYARISVGGSSGYRGDVSRSDIGSVYQPSFHARNFEERSKRVYREKMVETAKKFDKTTSLLTATQIMVQGLISSRMRAEDLKKADLEESEIVFEAVSSSLSSVGNAMLVAGMVASPNVALAGMGLSFISGLLDLGKHLYNLLSGKPKPEDPLVKKFNQYSEIVADSNKMGVRTCLMPGSDMVIYLSYRNDTSFKPSLESLNMYFIDVLDSVIYYLSTNNVIMDYSLTLVCPIGYLRSPDIDVNAYVNLKETREDVRFYQVTRLGAMLSKSPTVTFTCGKDITLTLKPFEIPLSSMQLLKMATPGEPEETKSIPSNVCDLFPLKNFYLLVKGCPFDSSKIAIAYTTCSILLRMSVWESEKQRWVLENPFDQKSRFKQLFTFSRFNFNDTIIKPNETPGHAKFCADRQSNQCHWYDIMVLDDITSCESRVRKIYVEIYLFTGNKGFTSFVLTCPSGSTPVAVGNKDGIIELPFSDLFTVKMFASVKKKNIGIFCVNDYDTRYRSDMIILKFVEPNFPKDALSLNTYDGQNKIFNSLVSNSMPHRSRTCSNAVSKECTSFHHRIDVWSPNYVVEIDVGSELMITEKYDPESATLENIEKSKDFFPHKLKLEYSLSGIASVYDEADRFWKDAKKKYRTFSSILIILLGCDIRKNIIKYSNDKISVMAYHQYTGDNYGDGKKYKFNKVSGGNCYAELDLTTKLVNIKCDEFSINRKYLKGYEGICAVTITSKDHCGTNWDDIKTHGYSSRYADSARRCDSQKEQVNTVYHPDNYCGRVILYQHSQYHHPKYEPCRSYMHIYYTDTWIEKDVLNEPPYAFNFKYDTNKNEYVDGILSSKLRDLYKAYKELYEYTEGTLPKSINRLANALTPEGRQITNVEVDSNVLEIAYLADMEKMAEIENKIKDLSKEILVNTLSDDDLYEIISKERYESCCLLDFGQNTSSKVYTLGNYSCGNIYDFIYEDVGDNYTSNMVLVNGTYMNYEMFSVSGARVVTCFEANVIPLTINSSKKEVQDLLLLHSVERGLDSLMMELDHNISSILLDNNITYVE
ncbi:B22R-like protein [Finch poxvirus]|uniref:B22R-like protein n=1 Tax=Condorpox virus TaxID=3049970 RepID=A0AAT9UQW0_9POXV|nr:B22R-like protein [Finch poxvirus]UOX39162.1 B22R-like protein [Finch poxvirus]